MRFLCALSIMGTVFLINCWWWELSEVSWRLLRETEAATQTFPIIPYFPPLCDIIMAATDSDVISGQSHPPPRLSVLRANCVLSLFGQQSFLKEIFFQRSLFCLFCTVVHFLLGEIQLIIQIHWRVELFLFSSLFFTFCKLKGKKQTKKIHKMDFVNKILTFCFLTSLAICHHCLFTITFVCQNS